MPVTHSFVSTIPDDADTSIVRPSNWNDEHVLALTAAEIPALPYGDISGTGVVGQVAEFVTDAKTLQAAKLIGPATNILTITNAAASTLALAITAAKTLTLTAADNYNITFPATLTVAGLAIANVFTANQTITPSSDVVTLTLNKPTTANILNIIGTATTAVSAAGNWGIATAPVAGTRLWIRSANFGIANEILYGAQTLITINPSAASATSIYGASFQVTGLSGFALNGVLRGLDVVVAGQNTATINRLDGLSFLVRNDAAGTVANTYGVIGAHTITAGTITQARNILVNFTLSGGSIGTAFNIRVDPPAISGGGAITTLYGLNIGNQGGAGITNSYGIIIDSQTASATLTYAIYTNLGAVRFGDNTLITVPTTTTNAVLEALRLQATVSTAATGGAAGFGPGLNLYAETATDGTNQQQAQIAGVWVDATNATRKAKLQLSAYDTAVRLGMEIEANGTTPDIKIHGDTWFGTTGSGLLFGSMYCEDAAVATTLTNANTYYNVTSGMTGGLENKCTFQNTKEIKILVAGVYEIQWAMSISVDASDQTIEGLVMAGASGTTALVQMANSTRAKENGVVYSVGGVGLVTCAVNDLIRFGLENETSAGTTITISHANMTIKQIGA